MNKLTKNNKESKDSIKEIYWKGWRNFFGFDEGWSKTKVQNWLKEFASDIKHYQEWDDATLQDTFTKLNVPRSHRAFHKFFKLFIEERNQPGGMYKVLDELNKILDGEFDLQTAISDIQKSKNKKKSKTPATVKEILYKARNTTIFDNHSKLFEEHVTFSVHALWNRMFNTSSIQSIKKTKKESKFSKAVIDTWRKERLDIGKIKFEDDYSQKKQLTLHQSYIGYKVNSIGHWFDMSETGAGKTDAALAVVATKRSTIKNTLIVCPNALIKNGQWKSFIKEAFPKSEVITTKQILTKKPSKSKRSFFVISYNTLSAPIAVPIMKKLASYKIDYIVMDEVQNVKIRDVTTISKRRNTIESFVKSMRTKNNKLKVLLLSATPVINNLKEAHSLLTIMTGKRYKNVKTHATFQNASALHTEFLLKSTRHEKQKKPYKVIEHSVDIKCVLNVDRASLIMDNKPMLTWLDLEKLSVEKKIDDIESIIKKNGGKYLIFTEYVTGIVDYLESELSKRFSAEKVTQFTGSDKSGILNGDFFKKADIMICSTPIAEGIDSLQTVCSNVIFAGYPWTAAKRDQIVGRIARQGQKKTVNVYNIVSELNGVNFDQEVKILRINFKRSFANCVVSGQLPKVISMPQRTSKRKELLTKMQEYEPSERLKAVVPDYSPTEIKLRNKKASLERQVKRLEKKKL